MDQDLDKMFEEFEDLESEDQTAGGSLIEVEWGQLHDSILDALLDGEEDWESAPVRALASSLRVETEELEAVFSSVNQETYAVKRLNKLMERQKLTKLGYDWSKLESAVLEKLGTLVATNRVSNASDLLAIAKTANSAIRRGSNSGVPQMTEKPNQQGGINLQVNQFGSGGLPGAGSLGRIELSLSKRTVEQLSRNKTIDLEAERLEDKIQMLTPNDVPELTKLADSKE